jgi:hypothetical protein
MKYEKLLFCIGKHEVLSLCICLESLPISLICSYVIWIAICALTGGKLGTYVSLFQDLPQCYLPQCYLSKCLISSYYYHLPPKLVSSCSSSFLLQLP